MSNKAESEIFVSFIEHGHAPDFESVREKLTWSDLRRLASFSNGEASSSFLLGRSLAFAVLAEFAPGIRLVPPVRLPGPPTLSHPEWNISISHACGCACVAIARGVSRLGADVELVRPMPISEAVEILRGTSAPSELAGLEGRLGDSERFLRSFFRHWTLKESFAKAVWQGLSFPFPTVSFEYAGDAGLEIFHSAHDERTPLRWDAAHFLLWERYCFSLSVEHDSVMPLRPNVGFLSPPLAITDVRTTSWIILWTDN